MDTTVGQQVGIEIPEAERLEPIHTKGLQRVFALMRVALGWTFLWAFLDKAFALGFSTGRDPATGVVDFYGKAAWIHGASPTKGVFAYALNAGWFTSFYEKLGHVTMTAQGPAANPPAWIDAVYMVSMLLIGVALITGVMTRIAALGGLVWVVIFYTATAIWPEHNPFLDEHVLEGLILVALVLANAGRYYGLGKIWQRFEFVRDRRYLY